MENCSYVHFLVYLEGEKPYRDGRLAVQRLNNSFVYNLWSWNMLYLGEEASSLLGFFLSRWHPHEGW